MGLLNSAFATRRLVPADEAPADSGDPGDETQEETTDAVTGEDEPALEVEGPGDATHEQESIAAEEEPQPLQESPGGPRVERHEEVSQLPPQGFTPHVASELEAAEAGLQQPFGLRLEARTGPDAGQTFPLSGKFITIGRSWENAIVLKDPKASQRHACIVQEDAGYVVEDAGSEAGTFLDGVWVHGVTLQPGGVLRLGETELLVQAA